MQQQKKDPFRSFKFFFDTYTLTEKGDVLL